MRPLLLPLAILAAAAILAGVGWLMLASAPPPPPPRAPAPPPPSPEPPALPVFAPEPGEEEEPAPPPPEEPAPAPDAWPGEVPSWWLEADRRFRGKEISIPGGTRTVEAIAAALELECGYAVRFDEPLLEWSRESSISLARFDGVGRGLVEALASRLNLEPVLEADALRLYRRGDAPDTPLARAGRVRWAVFEAIERREGKRAPDPAAPDLEAVTLELPMERVPLREASRRLGESLNIPVYVDGPLWATNPLVTVGPGPRPLREVLDRMSAPWEAAVDATPRRIVIFKPPR